jgi:hypothetical protein
MDRIPRARGNGKNQNSSGAEPVPKMDWIPGCSVTRIAMARLVIIPARSYGFRRFFQIGAAWRIDRSVPVRRNDGLGH